MTSFAGSTAVSADQVRPPYPDCASGPGSNRQNDARASVAGLDPHPRLAERLIQLKKLLCSEHDPIVNWGSERFGGPNQTQAKSNKIN